MQSKSRVQTTEEDLASAYYTWCKQIILPKRPINSYRTVKKGGYELIFLGEGGSNGSQGEVRGHQ